MKISKWLEALKQVCENGKPSIFIQMTPTLAEELLSLRPKSSRPLSSVHVWLWAFIYISGITPEEVGYTRDMATIKFDSKNNQLVDGGHRLAGFLTSGLDKYPMNLDFSPLG